MRKRGIKIVIQTAIIGIAACVIIGYAYFRSRPYLDGPGVVITYPQDGATLTASLLPLSGRTERVSSITLNGRKIFIDKDGIFNEEVLLFPGYNVITIEATDRFDKQTTERVQVLYQET